MDRLWASQTAAYSVESSVAWRALRLDVMMVLLLVDVMVKKKGQRMVVLTVAYWVGCSDFATVYK